MFVHHAVDVGPSATSLHTMGKAKDGLAAIGERKELDFGECNENVKTGADVYLRLGSTKPSILHRFSFLA